MSDKIHHHHHQVDSPGPLEEGPAASTNCQSPRYYMTADVVAVLPRLRATAPDGLPNEAFQSAPRVMVTQLESLLWKAFLGGRIPAASHEDRRRQGRTW